MSRPEAYKDFDLTDRPGEVWRDVVGFEGIYAVSNQGRVKSLDRIKKWRNRSNGPYKEINSPSRVRRQTFDSYKYPSLTLQIVKDGKYSIRTVKAHILVADAFLGPKLSDKYQVNHIDGNKTNNAVENLEYCTQSENQRHAFANGLNSNRGLRNSAVKLSAEQIVAIRARFNGPHGTYKQYKAVGEEYGVGLSTIQRVVLRKSFQEID